MLRCLAVLFTLLATPLAALEIRPGVPGLCEATLYGPITPGDAEFMTRFDFGDPPNDLGWEDGRWKALCLDSPGGQLTEALALARLFLDEGIGTVVHDGAECLSACALLFMFGTAYQIEANALTHRRLHVRGRLGFHQPELQLDETRSYSVEDMRKAYAISIETTLSLLALAARPRPDGIRPFIDSDLQEAMLQHKGQDFFLIDTINKAGRWDIATYGYTKPQLSESALLYACQNMTQWPAALAEAQVPYSAKDQGVFFQRDAWPQSDLKSARVLIEFPGLLIHECHLGVLEQWDGVQTPVICGEQELLNVFLGADDCRAPEDVWQWRVVPDWAFYPADTPLATLR